MTRVDARGQSQSNTTDVGAISLFYTNYFNIFDKFGVLNLKGNYLLILIVKYDSRYGVILRG